MNAQQIRVLYDPERANEALCPGMRPSDCIQPSSAHRGWPLLCKRRVSTKGRVFPAGFEC